MVIPDEVDKLCLRALLMSISLGSHMTTLQAKTLSLRSFWRAIGEKPLALHAKPGQRADSLTFKQNYDRARQFAVTAPKLRGRPPQKEKEKKRKEKTPLINCPQTRQAQRC